MEELTFESAIEESVGSGCGKTPEMVQTERKGCWRVRGEQTVYEKLVGRNNITNAGMKNAFT